MEDLVEAVIEEIKNDLRNGDETAIFEMLLLCPKEVLENYLPE